MSDELLPCPFCGSSDVVYHEGTHAGYGTIACHVCCFEYPTEDWNGALPKADAIKAWNTRAKKTCHDFGGEEGTNGEGYDFACTACGFCCDQPQPNYCPNCGAKVVD